MIKSLLVANRGEIAWRIVRAARDMGIRSIAVYSDADRAAPWVGAADEALPIGAAPPHSSYLDISRILDAASRSGAEAVHPGYGFLAERADFARRTREAGLVFVGPSEDAIAAMGDKVEARRRMERAGVPVVPGTESPLRDKAEAQREAERIGFPAMLKASAGGGGKGMRVVRSADEAARMYDAARREAKAAFGDGAIYLEKYFERPRHIEVQVFGDSQGCVQHFHDRDCSIQRRHQKLIEEAPSPRLPGKARKRMCETAVRAARAISYVGAGTVEFLYEDGKFYFLEMNTRIQVEHPVTELVTGVDLIGLQLRVASGEPLDGIGEDLTPRGHALECRITAESPFEGFLPDTGVISEFEAPSGPGVRWDGGIVRGSEVTLHYDSLLGKLIVHAPTRSEAIRRMRRALSELAVVGVKTSQPLLARVMAEPDFMRGGVGTGYLRDHPDLLDPELPDGDMDALAATAALLQSGVEEARATRGAKAGNPLSAWRRWG